MMDDNCTYLAKLLSGSNWSVESEGFPDYLKDGVSVKVKLECDGSHLVMTGARVNFITRAITDVDASDTDKLIISTENKKYVLNRLI